MKKGNLLKINSVYYREENPSMGILLSRSDGFFTVFSLKTLRDIVLIRREFIFARTIDPRVHKISLDQNLNLL